MSNRDKLRAKTVGAKRVFKNEIVTIDGAEFEVRQLSIRARNAVFQKARSDSGDIMTLEWMVWLVIESVYVPGTDELVFEPEDYDTLVAQPPGSFIDKLTDIAMDLANVDEKKIEKNLEKTGGDSSSSE